MTSPDSNLAQRKHEDWHQDLEQAARDARRRADEAEWPKDGGPAHPNAERLRREAQLLENRLAEGEITIPKF